VGWLIDGWVTQMLRQGDAKVFKKYSQMKLQMKREALEQLNAGPTIRRVLAILPTPVSFAIATKVLISHPQIVLPIGTSTSNWTARHSTDDASERSYRQGAPAQCLRASNRALTLAIGA
jgi:hypothetical protein